MSGLKNTNATITGKLTGFTKRWNPFSTEVFAVIRVDSRVINVPIDYRQKRMIQAEHPIDSLVPLVFSDGRWEIISQMVSAEQKLILDSSTVF